MKTLFRAVLLGSAFLTVAPVLAPAVAPSAVAKEPTWIVDKTLTLKIHMHFRDRFTWTDDWPVAKELTRLTNVKLTNTANKSAINSAEQFNLMMASGDLPDIVGGEFVGSANMKDAFIRYGIEGAFVPLNDLIDKHAPNLKAFFDSHPDVRKAISAPDGKIYYIPYVPDGVVARGWMIRKDWLDKLGLKEPKTVQELHDVLLAFKTRDPNGNGKADEIPFLHREPENAFRLVTLFGGRYSGSDAPYDFYVENGKVKHGLADPTFKTAIAEVAKWYKEGLIDPEIFTRRARAREELFGTDRGGATHDWFASTYNFNDSLAKTVPGFKIKFMPPPADINGKMWEENARAIVKPSGWAMTVANKNPIETIKLFDFYFTKQGRILSNFGVEGQQYDMKDGKPVYKDEVLKAARAVNSQMYDVGAQIPLGYWQDYEYERQWTPADAMADIDAYTQYLIPQFNGVNLTAEERAVYDEAWPDIRSYMVETAQNWFIGAKDVNQTWDDYQKRLKSMGYDKVMTVMQRAYDRQYGK
jgi:putative aldouronate transport system substrate-binding protein